MTMTDMLFKPSTNPVTRGWVPVNEVPKHASRRRARYIPLAHGALNSAPTTAMPVTAHVNVGAVPCTASVTRSYGQEGTPADVSALPIQTEPYRTARAI